MAQYDKLIGDRLELKVVYATSAEVTFSCKLRVYIYIYGETHIRGQT